MAPNSKRKKKENFYRRNWPPEVFSAPQNAKFCS
jgi:hypothetical protein